MHIHNATYIVLHLFSSISQNYFASYILNKPKVKYSAEALGRADHDNLVHIKFSLYGRWWMVVAVLF